MSAAFQIFTQPSQQALDTAANVLSGATLTFTVTGTSTPTDAYSEPTLTTPVANPLSANSAGVFAPIFLDPEVVYRVVLKTAAGSVLQTWDPANENIIGYFTQGVLGALLYPRTAVEIAAGVTPVNYAYPPGNVMRYGADINGIFDSVNALREALLANTHVFFPPGSFWFSEQIDIVGSKSIIGDRSGTPYGQATSIYFTGAGRWLSAAGGGFGYLYIGHFQVAGGSGDGEPCIYINRPQFIVEFITMESSTGYNNPGVKVENVGTATTSFSATIRCCKWVGPFTTPGGVVTPTAVAYIGFDIAINGGHILLEELVPIFGDIGIDIKQGQAIDIVRCNPNRQYDASSTNNATDGQCGIRLSGSLTLSPPEDPPQVPVNYKAAVSIRNGYVEACANGIVVASCESCSIEDNLVQDVSYGTKPGVSVLNGDAECVTIRNNQVNQANDNIAAIFNGSENNTRVESNWVDAYGTGGKWLSVNARTDIGWNSVIRGVLDDPAEYVFDLKEEVGTWTPIFVGSVTAGSHTYTLQFGRYRKVGRTVWFDFVIILLTKGGTIAGNLLIEGLPYTSRTDASGRIYNVAIGGYSNIDLSAGKTQVTATVSNNDTTIILIECGDNVALAALTAAALQNTTAIYGSGSYEI